jgi:hypothetical protein
MRIDDLVARKRKVHRIGESLKQLLVAVTFCLVFGYPLRFFVRSFALTVERILAMSMIARPPFASTRNTTPSTMPVACS